MNDYEDRKQARIARYNQLADKNNKQAEQNFKHAHDMASIIPFGQPILIGHHSEKTDRNFRKRIQNTYQRASQLYAKAEYYKEKAKTAESNTAISGDDPEAIAKLTDKIAKAEELQAIMRTFNKLLKNKDNEGMLALGFKQSEIDTLSKPDFCGRVGFPSYKLTNNNTNIHRMKQRLKCLQVHSNDTTTKKIIGDISIIDNVELNRLQIIFPCKPDDNMRKALKSSGFRWCPSEGAWQRHRSTQASYLAKQIVDNIRQNQ